MNAQSEQILAIERAAMQRWANGDPGGFLEASADEVVYFDPFLDARLDGLTALKALYRELEGKVHLDRWEFVNPRVVVTGEMALLTFNFVSESAEGSMRWNTTEVYRNTDAGWKIIHSHWSLTKPELASPIGG